MPSSPFADFKLPPAYRAERKVARQRERRKLPLAGISLCLGCVALVLGMIPVVGVFAAPLAGMGFVAGWWGLICSIPGKAPTKEQEADRMRALAGLAACGAAQAVMIFWTWLVVLWKCR